MKYKLIRSSTVPASLMSFLETSIDGLKSRYEPTLKRASVLYLKTLTT